MNNADVDKLHGALSITVNLEAHLKNFQGRSGRAGKFWTEWVKTPGRDPKAASNMKAALAALAKLTKDASVVLKDLDKAARAATDKKTLAKYATGKQYRDTVLVKQHASVRAWGENCTKFLTSISEVVPPFPFPKPAPGADETVTVESMKNFLHYQGEMKKALAQLG